MVSFVGLIWFLAFLSFQIFGFLHPDLRNDVQPIVERIFDIGAGLASFISPILQLALVLLIIMEAGRRIGIGSDGFSLANVLSTNAGSTSIQAIIAIIIVLAVSIAALGGIGRVDVLKDLALVVVGFYFGSRRQNLSSGLDPVPPNDTASSSQ